MVIVTGGGVARFRSVSTRSVSSPYEPHHRHSTSHPTSPVVGRRPPPSGWYGSDTSDERREGTSGETDHTREGCDKSERRTEDMEEEIIGNRWKELDYDGYCLRSSHPSSACALRSLRSLRAAGRVSAPEGRAEPGAEPRPVCDAYV